MTTSGRRRPIIALTALALLAGMSASSADAASLVGRAVLPADTFSVGPTSGQFITPANGRVPPSLTKLAG